MKTKEFLVVVEQRHIEEAERIINRTEPNLQLWMTMHACPLALAIGEQLGDYPFVSRKSFCFRHKDGWAVGTLPPQAQAFVYNHDTGRSLEPQRFILIANV